MSSDAAPIETPHTSIFLILLMPFGVSSGYVGVTLAFLLAAHGMKAAAVGSLIALAVLPQTWKVLWAPVVDTTLNAKTWYVLGALGVGLTIIAMSVIKTPMAAMPLLGALVVVSSIASTLTSMATEVFMANLDPHLRGAPAAGRRPATSPAAAWAAALVWCSLSTSTHSGCRAPPLA